MAGKPRNKPMLAVYNEGEEGELPIATEEGVTVFCKPENYQFAIEALERIKSIHDHPGSCSKNCPALIAQEALRKIRG